MGVRLGIFAGLMLTDPKVEFVSGHEWFNTPPARRTPVIKRQITIHHIRHQICAAHSKTANRIWLDIIIRLVKIGCGRESVGKLVRAIENKITIAN